MAGLNFANETEAISFKNAINEKLNIRQQKRQGMNAGIINSVSTSHSQLG